MNGFFPKYFHFFLLAVWLVIPACYDKGVKDENVNKPTVTSWTTTKDKSSLLTKKSFSLGTQDQTGVSIVVDTSLAMQTIDGFGYTLTGGSACLIMDMEPAARTALLNEIFGCLDDQLCISYLRVSIGSSDLNKTVFSYCDLTGVDEDPELVNFSLSLDTVDVIPVLREILDRRPDLKIMASPWSAPVWMKTNRNSIGGSLQKKYFTTYAKYFARYIKAMAAHGIKIDAITVQNEPLHGGNNPSMVMTSTDQATFIRDHLGPEFKAQNISTKIIIYDHNCDHPEYPMQILADSEASKYIDGTAFHLYAGDINVLSEVHANYPDKKLYFTEQWTGANSDFGADLMWHIRHVMIGSIRNWSSVALEWNLANDPSFQLHTPGGCTQCLGALTIDGSNYLRNVSYYIVGQISKGVPAGSVRVHSTWLESMPNVSFLRPDGKKVLFVLNDSQGPRKINVLQGTKVFNAILPPGSITTFLWN